ncbi:class I SAM-dependent methyltransferase [Alkaliphilus hydrothermalis]|uniref:Ubiquinone/menaquinone biosynthesis C-methylase UbiE n=1 Tax=Alkaliphilus hydrothermalis TaxID=1482730 RepID=A0ABS2NMJ0_9FIRM|nr:class I SAM-dependent methyltransferase [Alkaliphilus hydrothermalis]MBM7614161.1 ubiquinone/menaquinone biosynthesis C-methylase UbiE [Alkaliphilus hydrothermalis]
MLNILSLKGDEVIVDSGCGSGFYSLEITKRLVDGKVISVDISDEMLAKLRRQVDKKRLNNSIDIRKGDCAYLPVEDNSADVGIIVAVWHHLKDPDKANKELFRVIKPSGRIVAIDFKNGGHHKQDIENKHKTLGIEEMKSILKDAGFVNIKAEIVGSWVVGYADKP